MTEVDLTRTIELAGSEDSASGHVTVRIPVAEEFGPWVRCYARAAQADGVAASVEASHGRPLVSVTVPVGASAPQIHALLDAAIEVVEKAKALAVDNREANRATQELIREWWDRRSDQQRKRT